MHTKAGGEDPLVVTQFYYSQTFPYLMMKHHAEIPRVLQVHELLGHLVDGKIPTEFLMPLIKEMRNLEFEGVWH
jgi:hypothetical protein